MKMCGRCYEDVDMVFEPICHEKPERLVGYPIGQYHCPDCGAMLMAGCRHPQLCKRCLELSHPGFDIIADE